MATESPVLHELRETYIPEPDCCVVDTEHRDPKDINQHVKVAFHDVIAEPEITHSLDFIYAVTHGCFTYSRIIIYDIFTFILGLPLAFLWGVLFAVVSVVHIWMVTPALRCLEIQAYSCRKCQLLVLHSILAPFFEMIGLAFSKIKIVYTEKKTPTKQTKCIDG